MFLCDKWIYIKTFFFILDNSTHSQESLLSLSFFFNFHSYLNSLWSDFFFLENCYHALTKFTKNFALTTHNGKYIYKLSVTLSVTQDMIECLSLKKKMLSFCGFCGNRFSSLSTYIPDYSFPVYVTGLSFSDHTNVAVSSTIFRGSYSVLSDFPECSSSLSDLQLPFA